MTNFSVKQVLSKNVKFEVKNEFKENIGTKSIFLPIHNNLRQKFAAVYQEIATWCHALF